MEDVLYPLRVGSSSSRPLSAGRAPLVVMDHTDPALCAQNQGAAWGGCAYCGAIEAAAARLRPGALPRRALHARQHRPGLWLLECHRKCNEEVTGWLRRKRLDERVFLLRHPEINAMLALQFGSGNPEVSGQRLKGAEGGGNGDRPEAAPSDCTCGRGASGVSH